MNFLDIVFVSILTISIAFGMKRGLIKEMFTLLALILGIIIASRLYPFGAQMVSGAIDNTNLANIVSFIIIFFLIAILLTITGILLKKMITVVQMGWIDSLGGVVFGFLRGAVIVGVSAVFLSKYPILGSEKWIQGSSLAPFFLHFFESLWHLVPQELVKTIST